VVVTTVKKMLETKNLPLPQGAKHVATQSCTLSKGIASDFPVVWLLVQAKTKVDIALQ